MPYLVVGRYGMTPFPSKAPLRFIVGAPIAIPANPLGEKVREWLPCLQLRAVEPNMDLTMPVITILLVHTYAKLEDV